MSVRCPREMRNQKSQSIKTPISLIRKIAVQFGAENVEKIRLSLVSISKGIQKQDLKAS